MDLRTDAKLWSMRLPGTKNEKEVRWTVGGRRFSKADFGSRASAEVFHAHLRVAVSRGDSFDADSGLPAEMVRPADVNFLAFARAHVEAKWAGWSASSRKAASEALTRAACHLVDSRRGLPAPTRDRDADELLRDVLHRHVFSVGDDTELTREEQSALAWLERHSLPLSKLRSAELVEQLLDVLARTLDGRPASKPYYDRRRAVVYGLLKRAVQQGIFTVHPFDSVTYKRSGQEAAIGTDEVPSDAQAAGILAWLRDNAPRYFAFFAVMMLAALRPSEAAALRVQDIELPKNGGPGLLRLRKSAAAAGKRWTDTGEARDNRGLKWRPATAYREVPVSAVLAAILREAIGDRTDGKDLVFRSVRGGKMMSGTAYLRWWHMARHQVVGDTAHKTFVPYDCRHYCVSAWLRADVPPKLVAEWAGHSVTVLLTVYAAWIGSDAEQRSAANAAVDATFAQLAEPQQPAADEAEAV